MTVNQIIKYVEVRKKRIEAARDDLETLEADISELVDDSDEALICLRDAIDALRRTL